MNDNRLRQELTHRGLPAHGLKPALVERLQQAIDNPLLAQQLASTTMQEEMHSMLNAGDVESIRLWLDVGVDVDIAEEGEVWTPMLITCFKGHVALVRLLLDAGADTQKVSNQGCTPLFIACQQGHEEMVRMLLGEGADKDGASNHGVTPLFN